MTRIIYNGTVWILAVICGCNIVYNKKECDKEDGYSWCEDNIRKECYNADGEGQIAIAGDCDENGKRCVEIEMTDYYRITACIEKETKCKEGYQLICSKEIYTFIGKCSDAGVVKAEEWIDCGNPTAGGKHCEEDSDNKTAECVESDGGE